MNNTFSNYTNYTQTTLNSTNQTTVIITSLLSTLASPKAAPTTTTSTTSTMTSTSNSIGNFIDEFYSTSVKLYYIKHIGSILLFFFGILGNSFSYMIFQRPQLRQRSKYLSYLTIMDSCALWLLMVSKIVFLTSFGQTDLFCKFYLFNLYWIWQSCSWISALISIDGLFELLSPNRHQYLRTKSFQNTCLLTVFVILVILNIPSIYFTDLFLFNTKAYCIVYDLYQNFLSIMNLMLFAVIPFSIMLICAIIMVVFSYKKLRNREESVAFKDSKEYDVFITTVSTIVLFLICNFPIACVIVYSNYNDIPFNLVAQMNINIVYTASFLLVYSYNSIPFSLYFIVNRKFQQETLVCFRSLRMSLRKYCACCNYCDRNTSDISEPYVQYHNTEYESRQQEEQNNDSVI